VGGRRTFSTAAPTSTTPSAACQAFEAAGADVLFAPGLTRPEQIRTVVASLRKPVTHHGMRNAALSVAELAPFGVRRISVGSASPAALGAFARAAREIRELGTFRFAEEALPTLRSTTSWANPCRRTRGRQPRTTPASIDFLSSPHRRPAPLRSVSRRPSGFLATPCASVVNGGRSIWSFAWRAFRGSARGAPPEARLSTPAAIPRKRRPTAVPAPIFHATIRLSEAYLAHADAAGGQETQILVYSTEPARPGRDTDGDRVDLLACWHRRAGLQIDADNLYDMLSDNGPMSVAPGRGLDPGKGDATRLRQRFTTRVLRRSAAPGARPCSSSALNPSWGVHHMTAPR